MRGPHGHIGVRHRQHRQRQDAASTAGIRSLIPARIDRLTWAPFHTRMVLALGTAWVLDGLEITIAERRRRGAHRAGDARPQLRTQVGAIATVYLLGEVFGALFFGRLSDALGRKNLFVVTLGRLPGRQRADRADLGQQHAGAGLPVPDPVHRRCRHRRRVRGDQLGDRRDDAGAATAAASTSRVNGTYWGGAILGTLGTLRPAQPRST